MTADPGEDAGLSGAIPRSEYHAIVSKLDAIPSMACPNFRLIKRKHPSVPMRTLLGLFSQEAQYRVIRTHHVHKGNMAQYCARYRRGVDVLEICAAADFPACLMMRRMLEAMLGLSKQRVSDVLKDPSLLTPALLPPGAAADADEALLARLRADVVRCARADRSYSPYSDLAKTLAGLEHEEALYAALRRAGVPYWSEADLRGKGLYKTPDALLQVPIAVRCPLTGRWHIVHWLDSKASFGDDRLHSQASEAQYRTYANRYGSGAALYWLGFISDLASASAGGSSSSAAAAGSAGARRAGGGGGGDGWDGCEGGGAGAGAGGGGGDACDVLLLERFPAPDEIQLLLPPAAAAAAAAATTTPEEGASAAAAAPPQQLPRHPPTAGPAMAQQQQQQQQQQQLQQQQQEHLSVGARIGAVTTAA